MSLRIAFDLDGTVADLDTALAGISERLFGREPEDTPPEAAPPEPKPRHPVRPEDSPNDTSPPGAVTGAARGDLAGDGPSPEEEQVTPPRVRALTQRQQQMVWEAARGTNNFWETLEETEPGVVSRIAAIAVERRWEVIFLTQRPPSAGDTTQRQSQRWLAAHGFELPSVFVISGSRGKVAASLNLDLVVDDRPENCLDVKVDSHARAALVVRSGNPNIPANAARMGIEAFASVGQLLDRLDAAPRDTASILGRLKRMIGR